MCHTHLHRLFLAGSMQGNCGSCWAHAGVSAIEAKLLIQDGLLSNETSVSLSMQQVVSCPRVTWGGLRTGSTSQWRLRMASLT